MKRIISIVVLTLLAVSFVFTQEAVNREEEQIEKKAEIPVKQFQPPEWILGEWSDFFRMNMWTFNEKDVLLNQLSLLETYGPEAIVNVRQSDTEYSFTMKIGEDVYAYVFEKDSELMMTYTRYSDGQTVGPIDLIKL